MMAVGVRVSMDPPKKTGMVAVGHCRVSLYTNKSRWVPRSIDSCCYLAHTEEDQRTARAMFPAHSIHEELIINGRVRRGLYRRLYGRGVSSPRRVIINAYDERRAAVAS